MNRHNYLSLGTKYKRVIVEKDHDQGTVQIWLVEIVEHHDGGICIGLLYRLHESDKVTNRVIYDSYDEVANWADSVLAMRWIP